MRKNMFLSSDIIDKNKDKSENKNELEYDKLIKKIDEYLSNKIEDSYKKIYENYIENFYYKNHLKIYFTFQENLENFFEVIKDFENNEFDFYLKSIYVDLDYFKRNDILNREFKGRVLIGEFRYIFKFILEKDLRYSEKINELKEIGIYNNYIIKYIPNYIFDKMYRIKVTSFENEEITMIDLINNLENIEYDFSEFSKKIYFKKIYWNINEISLISSKKLYLNLNEINFNYQFNKESGDLLCVDVKEITNIFLEKNKLNIVSTCHDKKIWRFLKIYDINESFKNIFSNIINFGNLTYILNEINVNNILKNNYIFQNISLIAITDYEDNYINFKENTFERRLVYIVIRFDDNEIEYDKLYYLKEILETIFSMYTFRIRLWKEV